MAYIVDVLGWMFLAAFLAFLVSPDREAAAWVCFGLSLLFTLIYMGMNK